MKAEMMDGVEGEGGVGEVGVPGEEEVAEANVLGLGFDFGMVGEGGEKEDADLLPPPPPRWGGVLLRGKLSLTSAARAEAGEVDFEVGEVDFEEGLADAVLPFRRFLVIGVGVPEE